MGRIFNPENPVFRFLSGIFDMILLNVLFILTSLPLFTIGASLTALYAVLLWRANRNVRRIRVDPQILRTFSVIAAGDTFSLLYSLFTLPFNWRSRDGRWGW